MSVRLSVRALGACVVGVALSLVSKADAALFATATASNINSNGGSAGSAAAGTFTYTFTGLSGAYTLKSANISGTVEKVASADSAGEKRLAFSAAPAFGYTQQIGFNPTFAAYAGSPLRSTVTNVNWNVTDVVVANGSKVTFKFYDSVNDGGDSGVDGIWRSFSAAFDGDPAATVTPTAIDAGTLSPVLAYGNSGSIFATGDVKWYKFTLAQAVSGTTAGAHRHLDITSNIIGGGTTALDTVLALYDSTGKLLVTDDESGTGSKSALSFGGGSGEVLNPGDSTPILSTGQNGDLTAGTYYLAVAPFSASFADAFLAQGGSSSGGFGLTLAAGPIPEPASLGLLVPLALLTKRRR